MVKLFTIGDSISQGFMSGACAQTEHTYSSLIAQQLGIYDEYSHPDWKWVDNLGIPLNLEGLLRKIADVVKNDNEVDTLDLPRATVIFRNFLQANEKYHEKKDSPGHYDKKGLRNQRGVSVESFQNIAVEGFTVADAWTITANFCKDMIQERGDTGNLFEPASTPFYRIAYQTLNPQSDPAHMDKAAIDWLEVAANSDDGVENVILWLGANNALGTVVNLKIDQTDGIEGSPLFKRWKQYRTKVDKPGYKGSRHNLWHPVDFKAEYLELLDRLEDALKGNKHHDYHVFVGTVPELTIAPLAKGVGSQYKIKRKKLIDGEEKEVDRYYSKYYTYFYRNEDYAWETGNYLSMQDAVYIDNVIREYNRFIKEETTRRNMIANREIYHIVDIADAMDSIAFKRNGGDVMYKFPDYFTYKYPPVNTKFYHASRDEQLVQGGLFSLDGVHPTVIGQGLIAYEFLKKMNKVGVQANDGKVISDDLNWDAIFEADKLYSEPIPIMTDIYKYEWLLELFVQNF